MVRGYHFPDEKTTRRKYNEMKTNNVNIILNSLLPLFFCSYNSGYPKDRGGVFPHLKDLIERV
jgi:hypothetical protein